MDLILAAPDGKEERVMPEDIDLDCGTTNDFQVNIRYATWTGDIKIGKLVYVPGAGIWISGTSSRLQGRTITPPAESCTASCGR